MKVDGLRSPHEKTGELVYFGRMLDKIRLHAEGKLPGDYTGNLGSGFDGRCCSFLWVEYPTLVARVQQGGGDAEILEWCYTQGRKPSAEEFEIWNEFMRKRGWDDEATPILHRRLREGNFEHRTDILTMFDYIDLDEGRDPADKASS